MVEVIRCDFIRTQLYRNPLDSSKITIEHFLQISLVRRTISITVTKQSCGSIMFEHQKNKPKVEINHFFK